MNRPSSTDPEPAWSQRLAQEWGGAAEFRTVDGEKRPALCIVGVARAVFAGATDWVADGTVTVSSTNDRAGAIGEWMNRTFDLRNKRLLIPSNSAGAETQLDALIA